VSGRKIFNEVDINMTEGDCPCCGSWYEAPTSKKSICIKCYKEREMKVGKSEEQAYREYYDKLVG